MRWNRRAGGRTGAIALAATGVAAAYIDVVAVTTIYEWVAPAVGLLLAAVISGAGLTLARRWDSQHLGLLVLVPLLILAPVVVDGISLLLIGFMLALSAAALPVQLGRDWIWLHAARTAAATVPLLIALAGISFGSGDDPWLLGGACGVAALLAVAGALILLPSTANGVAMALLTVTGTAPVLLAGLIVNRTLGALLAAALSAVMLAVVTAGRRIPGVVGPVVQIWSALAAVSALIAVTVAFDGYVAAPVLFALSLVTAIAGRYSSVSRWAAIGFATVGMMLLWAYAPVSTLFAADGPANVDSRVGARRQSAPGRLRCRDRVVRAGGRRGAALAVVGDCGGGVELRRDHLHRHRGCAGGRCRRWLPGRAHGGDDLLDRHGGRVVRGGPASAPRGPDCSHRRRPGPDRGRDRQALPLRSRHAGRHVPGRGVHRRRPGAAGHGRRLCAQPRAAGPIAAGVNEWQGRRVTYDAHVPNPRGLLNNPVVAAVVGAGAVAVGGASAAYRGATRIPLVGAQLGRGVEALSRRGEDALAQNLEPVRSLITTVAVQIVDRVLAELDLTTLVRERVDIDAVIRDIDIDAIIARIDLVGLADTVIDGVDLPRIIRESTTSVTADVMTDVRTQGERADDLVSGLVDRMLGRAGRAEP